MKLDTQIRTGLMSVQTGWPIMGPASLGALRSEKNIWLWSFFLHHCPSLSMQPKTVKRRKSRTQIH